MEKILDFLCNHLIDLAELKYYFAILLLFCLVVSLYDIKYKRIPDWILAIFVIIRCVLFLPPFNQTFLYEYLFGFIFGFFIIFIPAFIMNQPMGGDIKFSAVLGFYLGIGWLSLALVVSLISFIIVSVILKCVKKFNFKTDTLAYGPFLGLGVCVCGLVYIL